MNIKKLIKNKKFTFFISICFFSIFIIIFGYFQIISILNHPDDYNDYRFFTGLTLIIFYLVLLMSFIILILRDIITTYEKNIKPILYTRDIKFKDLIFVIPHIIWSIMSIIVATIFIVIIIVLSDIFILQISTKYYYFVIKEEHIKDSFQKLQIFNMCISHITTLYTILISLFGFATAYVFYRLSKNKKDS